MELCESLHIVSGDLTVVVYLLSPTLQQSQGRKV